MHHSTVVTFNPGMLTRLAKCEHKAEAKKICQADAREATLTINY